MLRVQFVVCVFFFQAEDGIRYLTVTGVQTCALPIYRVTLSADRSTVATGVATSVHGGDSVRDNCAKDRLAQIVPYTRAIDSWWRASRSEERRVGKEGRSRWSPYH